MRAGVRDARPLPVDRHAARNAFNLHMSNCFRAMRTNRHRVNPFKFLSNRVLKTICNSEGLTSHKLGGFMHYDYMTSKDRLIFLDSKHKRTDPLFKTILCLMVVVAVAQVIKHFN